MHQDFFFDVIKDEVLRGNINKTLELAVSLYKYNENEELNKRIKIHLEKTSS